MVCLVAEKGVRDMLATAEMIDIQAGRSVPDFSTAQVGYPHLLERLLRGARVRPEYQYQEQVECWADVAERDRQIPEIHEA